MQEAFRVQGTLEKRTQILPNTEADADGRSTKDENVFNEIIPTSSLLLSGDRKWVSRKVIEIMAYVCFTHDHIVSNLV